MQTSLNVVARAMLAGSIAIIAAGCFAPSPAEAQVSFQTERHDHPNMARAVDQMVAAYADMARAPSDFGGNKVQAMQALRSAIVSAKRALYYRMKMDDNALWRAP